MLNVTLKKMVIGALFSLLVISRLLAIWPHMSTQPLDVPTDWRTLSGDEVTYDMPAYNLLSGHGYSNCLHAPYEPSLLRTPTYPLVLAATYAIFGRNTASVVGLNLVCDLITAILLFDIARRKLGPWTAIGVLGAIVLWAPWSDFVDKRLSESLATLLLMISLRIFIERPSYRRWFVLGLSLGVLLLCRPTFAFLPIAIAISAILPGSDVPSISKRRLFTALGIGVFVLWSPWLVRNAMSTGRFIPLSYGTGMTLWVGTWYENPPFWLIKQKPNGLIEREIPDIAFASPEERERVLPQFHRYIELYFANGSDKMREPDKALGEIAQEKVRKDPLHWLNLRTRMTIKMMDQRYFGVRLIKNATLWMISHWLIGILAAIGSIMSWRQTTWRPVAIVFLYTLIIHFPTHGEPRYLASAYGAAILLAACALQALANWVAQRRPRTAAGPIAGKL